jgi:hypothetical protein
LTKSNFRTSYNNAFNEDKTLFRRQSGDLAKHLDAAKTAIIRPAQISAFATVYNK